MDTSHRKDASNTRVGYSKSSFRTTRSNGLSLSLEGLKDCELLRSIVGQFSGQQRDEGLFTGNSWGRAINSGQEA